LKERKFDQFLARNCLGNSLLRDHTICSSWRLILDQFLKVFGLVWSLEKVVCG